MGHSRHRQTAPRAKMPSPSENVNGIVAQAYTKLEAGSFKKASELAERALRTCTQPAVLDSLGEIFSVAGDFKKAATCYIKALGYDHLSHAAGLRYITLYEITGDPAHLTSAVPIFRRQATISTKNSQASLILVLAMLADAYLTRFEHPDVKSSIRTAEEAISIDPTQIEPHISLAGAHLVAEAFDLAEKSARNALSLMEGRGLFTIETADDGTEELIVHPDDNQPSQQFLLALSRVCAGIEMYEQGAMCCDLILAQNPKDAVALHDLAWCYNLAGEYEDARDVLLQVKQIYVEENAGEELIMDIDEKINALVASAPTES